MLGGRKVTVTRPRARHLDGSGEVELATYKHFNTEDLLGEMALERMVAGLSTRNYSAGLEPVGDVEAIRIDDLDRAHDDAKRQALARRKDDRWTAAGMLEAEKRFYRVQGYRDIPALKAALRTCLREVIGSEEEAA